MRGLLVVVVLIAVGIVGLGFYRGWFQVSSESADQKSNVTFSVDKDKIQADEHTAKEKVHDLGHKAKEGVNAGTDKVKDADKPKQE